MVQNIYIELSVLSVTIINLLIAISTNEQAISLALSSSNDKDQQRQENLIKQIFTKCYLPSIELLHDPSVSEDFAKKIIMLYSQSLQAKKQIEKVIENTFVSISQLVDLSKDKIEEIVSNQDKLQSFYGYSKSLQALFEYEKSIMILSKKKKYFLKIVEKQSVFLDYLMNFKENYFQIELKLFEQNRNLILNLVMQLQKVE